MRSGEVSDDERQAESRPQIKPAGNDGERSPCRLLLITYEYPPLGGGLGKAVRQTAIQLARRGFEVRILTSRFGDLKSHETDGALEILRVPVVRRHARHASVTDVLSFGLSGIFLAKRQLEGFRPDVIIAYLTIPSGVIGVWLASRFQSPLMTLLRGTDVPGPGRREVAPWMHWLAGPLVRWIWRRSARIVSNSGAMARQAESVVPWAKIETVHNGVDLDRFRPPDSGVRDSTPIRVLSAARLVKAKRQEVLLDVWAEVVRKIEGPALLEFAGFGPERERLEQRARKLGIEDRVRFLGFLEEDALITVYQRASVFVSLSCDEGLPNSVLEALACGLPAVLSDIGPHREILDDFEAGVLCSVDRRSSVTAVLVELIQNAEKRKLMSLAARSAVEGRFSWEASAEGLIRLLPSA